MFKDTKISKSYLSMNELIYHAAIIGLVVGVIELFYEYFNILSSGETLPSEGSYIFILLIPLIYPIATALGFAVSALVSYPLYSYWAKKKGGLNIYLKQHNDSE